MIENAFEICELIPAPWGSGTTRECVAVAGTEESAVEKAKELATEAPGRTYVVKQTLCFVVVKPTVEIRR